MHFRYIYLSVQLLLFFSFFPMFVKSLQRKHTVYIKSAHILSKLP